MICLNPQNGREVRLRIAYHAAWAESERARCEYEKAMLACETAKEELREYLDRETASSSGYGCLNAQRGRA